ncbi:diacylglycerol lipase-alpha isoform X2 [Frankliniella occidentalis]|uniref:Diacylglycerol lipase-alpha n=1 Tax=Frankliniella occidentalis TaxID=133901 RepID=A0A9C6XE03_FRAOC|nr:diacylglycerol lipase-alpha isoform X2 [Frankliniella occidentalis]
MPGIVIFRRRWSVGSDDLVVPGVFLFVAHLIWVAALVAMLATTEIDRSSVWCVRQLWRHFVGYLCILVVYVVLEGMISATAMRGGILEVERRSSIKYQIYCRLGVMVFELVWLVLGCTWLVFHYDGCQVDNTTKNVMLALIISNGVMFLSVVLTGWCSYDAAGRSWVKMKKYQRSMREAESRFQYKRSGSRNRNWRQRKVMRAYQQSWNSRCKWLFCCVQGTDRNRNSFTDIARLLSDFFRDLDVVPSDVVAGLVLLRKFQKIEREAIVTQRKNDTYEFLSGVAVTSQTRFLALHDPEHYQHFQDVIHYMNFALAAYGWPMYLMTNQLGLCKLCPKLSCMCMPCLGPKDSAVIVEDNCCQCNYAALQKMVQEGDVDVVYATYHVEVGETPFFVAVDYDRQKVVISIRGTLSMKDVITDLNAESETLPLDPPREDWSGHKGMVHAALYIQEKLDNDNVLVQAFNHCAERGTQDFGLVLVGHSLGAGAAAILAIMMRQQYPDLQCFAYSPPGGLLSMPAVEYSKQFITSVVVGKDVVPRIGLHQMESLRADLINAIKRSKDPKWKTIMCSVVCCGCAHMPTSAVELGADDSNMMEYQKEKDIAREVAYHPNDSSIALTVHQPLYPPGRIIHVVRHHPKKGEQVLSKNEPVYQALWANNTDFDEVLISPVMIQDHMPDTVLSALKKVITTVGPAKPQRAVSTITGTSPLSETLLDSERCRLLNVGNLTPCTPNAPTPPHRLLLETSFTSLQSPCTEVRLTSGSLNSSNGSQARLTSSSTGVFKWSAGPPVQTPPAALSGIPWECASSVEDRYNSRPSSSGHGTGSQKKVDLIHDDWFGLAPLATPESLSEVSSISSRTSSVHIDRSKEYFSICGRTKLGASGNQDVVLVQGPGESPAFPVLLHSSPRTPRVLRRTPKINGNLSTAAEDVGSNIKFAMTNINLASIAVRRNLPVPLEDSNTLTNSSEDEDVSLESFSRPNRYPSDIDVPVRRPSPLTKIADQSSVECCSEVDCHQLSPCPELAPQMENSPFTLQEQVAIESTNSSNLRSHKGPVCQTSADSGNYQCGSESLATSECSGDSLSGPWSAHRQTCSEGISSISPPASASGTRSIVPDALPLLKNIGLTDTGERDNESILSFGKTCQHSYPTTSVEKQESSV